ncbi:MAG: hypothetical protein AB1646_19955 [Thermodesulfobacteriota bacterium]
MSLAEDRFAAHVLGDPKLQQEFDRLKTDEDREDFLAALEALEEVERDGAVSWESLKSDLGL